jgi:uncharacterized protein
MLETLSEVQALDLQRDAIAVERGEVPAELLGARERHAALLRRPQPRQHDHEDLRRRVAATSSTSSRSRSAARTPSESALRAATTKEMAQYQNQELQFATRAQELEEDTLPLMEELEARPGAGRARGPGREMEPELEALEAASGSASRRSTPATPTSPTAARASRTEVEPDACCAVRAGARARRGLALVGLQDGKRCGGCHVQLPIHVVQKVRKGEGVTRCPSCGRLLHQTRPPRPSTRRTRAREPARSWGARCRAASAQLASGSIATPPRAVRGAGAGPVEMPGRADERDRLALRTLCPTRTRMRLACAYQVSAPPAWRILTRLP